jgi:hypothetical protein
MPGTPPCRGRRYGTRQAADLLRGALTTTTPKTNMLLFGAIDTHLSKVKSWKNVAN